METDFLKEIYFSELERRDHLDESPGRLVGLLSLVSAVFAYYLKTFSLDATWLSTVFSLCVVVAAVLFSLTVVWIIRASLGFSYHYLGSASDYEKYRGDLAEFYSSTIRDKTELEETVRAEVAVDIRSRLVTSVTRNANHNNRRSELFYQAKLLIVGLLITVPCTGLLVLAQVAQKQAT